MKKLIKKQNKEFTVLNLTDTHMDDALLNADCVFLRILNSTVESLVERVKPDLITITGDFAWGGHSKGQKYLVDKLDSFNIPWAPVLGNHDQDAGEEGIRTLESFFEASKYCIYEKGDPALGHGNYVVTVEEEITGNPVEGLIFMDSHRLDTYTDKKGNETAVWARLWDNQIEWYLKQAEELKNRAFSKPRFLCTYLRTVIKGHLTRRSNPESENRICFLRTVERNASTRDMNRLSVCFMKGFAVIPKMKVCLMP